jgi:hypothetical protein
VFLRFLTLIKELLMKSMMPAFALFLLSLAVSPPLRAQSSAQGSVRFMMEDGLIKTVELSVSKDERGTTTGSLTFSDEAKVPDTNDPENPAESFALFVTAKLDDSTFDKNRALLSGTILDSSHRTYIGKRVQLLVEDNGVDPKVPDLLAWTFCIWRPGGWVPSDAELSRDDGAFLRWWATDAERKDDVGIPSADLIPREGASCPAWPLWSYTFDQFLRWEGDIVVQP